MKEKKFNYKQEFNINVLYLAKIYSFCLSLFFFLCLILIIFFLIFYYYYYYLILNKND